MSDHAGVNVVSGEELLALTKQNKIVFVDFWATWCAPCRQFGVVFQQVAAQYPDVIFAKINLEEEQELAEAFHIQSIPHLMVFKQGVVIYSEAGSMPESVLNELVEQAIAADVSQIIEGMNKES